ncbi:hypothetical protein [Peribacillus frigoritolerans]|uniref:Uncharacterized protein n=1 Tax=Peribacillus castrilensis TaxID=2897690 RepID=A0AAW9NJI8_9BACI|nr:hypothetical protein [Peribacillus castrilensis]
MSTLAVLTLSIGILLIILNIHVGFVMAKGHGKWQYGVFSWGIAAFVGTVLIGKLL